MNRSLSLVLALCMVIACRSDARPPSPSDPLLSLAVQPEGTARTGQPPASTEPPTQRAPRLVPQTPRQETLRGIAHRALDRGDNDLAIGALIALMETPEPSGMKASALLLLAELYYQEGNPDRALAIHGALADQFPPVAEFELVFGRTLGELGRYDQAEPRLRHAIALKPHLLQSYIALGSLLVATNRPDEAGGVYTRYEAVLAEMLRIVSDSGAEVSQRIDVLDAIGLADPDDRITTTLVTLLNEDELVVCSAAIRALAESGTEDAIPPLEAFAERAQHRELAAFAAQAAQQIRMRR